jgi:Mycothiol maleylpyruvate isomerase N-terminal domain
MDAASGAIGLLVGAISYMLGVCAPIGPAEMTLPTPCADWDLAMLLGHLCRSMADLETALRTGQLDLEEPAIVGGGPERFVAVGGLPMPAGLVACTGAVEIAVHGWDVSAARARAGQDSAGRDSAGQDRAGRGADVRGTPIPAGLAARMLRLSPLLVAGREGLFAVPVEVPAQASPGDRLIGYLGRNPGSSAMVTGE